MEGIMDKSVVQIDWTDLQSVKGYADLLAERSGKPHIVYLFPGRTSFNVTNTSRESELKQQGATIIHRAERKTT
jgi:hypothetical protein